MKVIDGIELLRMIKDGEIKEKQRFTDGLLKLEYFDKTIKVCRFSSDGTYDYYEDDYEVADLISHKFTIIEEEKEIEELEIEQMENNPSCYYIRNEYGTKCCLTKHSKIMADKINELVRELNKIKKEGK